MTNKEALHEFQTRLSNRLQAARNAGVSLAWLAVHIDVERYLFPLNQCGEIFDAQVPQRVPYTQAWFLGVANLRGGLYGVVDLAGFMGAQSTDRTIVSDESDTHLITLNPGLDINCALRVNRLMGLRSLEAFVRTEPCVPGSPSYFGHVYTDAQQCVWQEIDLGVLIAQVDFLNISN